MSEQSSKDAPFVPTYLLYLLAAVSERASAQFHARVRQSGLRVPEWRVLSCLHDQDGEMITHLAEFALIEQSRLTRIIDQMDNRGFVTRRVDELDRRRVRVFLTRKGASIAEKLITEAKLHEHDLLTSAANINAATFKQHLRDLLDCLEQE